MWKFCTRSVIQSVTIITANFASFQPRSATAFGPFPCHSVPLQELVGLRRRYPVRHFKQSQEWHFPETLEKQYMREQLRREEIISLLKEWNRAWDRHDLEGVMNLFHEEIIFENWTGGNARGKEALRQAWEPWFRNHGGFRFVEEDLFEEDLFIDEAAQKVLYQAARSGCEPLPRRKDSPQIHQGEDHAGNRGETDQAVGRAESRGLLANRRFISLAVTAGNSESPNNVRARH